MNLIIKIIFKNKEERFSRRSTTTIRYSLLG